jgi:hypothetical protein
MCNAAAIGVISAMSTLATIQGQKGAVNRQNRQQREQYERNKKIADENARIRTTQTRIRQAQENEKLARELFELTQISQQKTAQVLAAADAVGTTGRSVFDVSTQFMRDELAYKTAKASEQEDRDLNTNYVLEALGVQYLGQVASQNPRYIAPPSFGEAAIRAGSSFASGYMQGSQMFPDAGTVGNTGTTTAATAATASSASYSSPVNAYVPVNIELPAPISLADYGIG